MHILLYEHKSIFVFCSRQCGSLEGGRPVQLQRSLQHAGIDGRIEDFASGEHGVEEVLAGVFEGSLCCQQLLAIRSHDEMAFLKRERQKEKSAGFK